MHVPVIANDRADCRGRLWDGGLVDVCVCVSNYVAQAGLELLELLSLAVGITDCTVAHALGDFSSAERWISCCPRGAKL